MVRVSRQAASDPLERPQESRVRILLVEDDEGQAVLIGQSLAEAQWYDVIHFRDGQFLLDFLLGSGTVEYGVAERYVVLLDIRMPKMGGIETLERMKADSRMSRIPVIMLSTADGTEELERCYALGCGAYVQKPTDYDRFADVIRGLGQFIRLLSVPSFGK